MALVWRSPSGLSPAHLSLPFAVSRAWRLHGRLPARLLSTSSPTSDPLRILFCGADEFSIVHLQALAAEKLRNGGIQTIEVVHRPAKRTGHKLKVLREVPVHKVAKDLQLAIHEIDTFTGWNLPASHYGPFNLIIAVSFGLKVPARILNGVKFGGWNLHPSLLPDLRGPAPILRSLLLNRKHMGVTLQTLHPTHFDHGEILAQTLPPGIPIPTDISAAELRDMLAQRGAEMLIASIRTLITDINKSKDHPSSSEEDASKSSLPSRGSPQSASPYSKTGPFDFAGKITKEDQRIEWSSWDVDRILRYQRILGKVWSVLGTELKMLVPSTETETPGSTLSLHHGGSWKEVPATDVFGTSAKRINFSDLKVVPRERLPASLSSSSVECGTLIWLPGVEGEKGSLYIRTKSPSYSSSSSSSETGSGITEEHGGGGGGGGGGGIDDGFSGYLEVVSCTLDSGKKEQGVRELVHALSSWVGTEKSS